MLFRTLSASVYGIDADLVDIEVDLTPVRGEADQTSVVIIVGLPDAAVRESREHIRAAISNCGFFFPFQKITINLAPADVRKEEPASISRLPWGFLVRMAISRRRTILSTFSAWESCRLMDE